MNNIPINFKNVYPFFIITTPLIKSSKSKYYYNILLLICVGNLIHILLLELFEIVLFFTL